MSDVAEECGLQTNGNLVSMFVQLWFWGQSTLCKSCLKIVSELLAATMSGAAEAL